MKPTSGQCLYKCTVGLSASDGCVSWELVVDCGAVADYTEMMVVMMMMMMMMMINPFPVTDVLTVGRSGAAG